VIAVTSFQVHYRQYLDRHGRVVQPVPESGQDAQTLLKLYRQMQLTRLFDSRAISLQRTGQMGTYASSEGQEAIGTGLGSAMRSEDVLLPAYREYAAQFMRGVAMADIYRYWGGYEQGMNFSGPREDFPIAVPVASQACHAAGVAAAFRYRHEARVAVCVLGDGATSKGDFYEALNLAGAWRLPLVFVINNNQWAISVPRSAQSACETLAQKAIAGGIPGEQVDGNDVIAVREACLLALERARGGAGPSLIEALSYRLGDHTTADDASHYRDPAIVEQQREYDPIERLRRYLMAQKLWGPEREAQLIETCGAEVEAAAAAYLDTPDEPPQAMFDSLYAELPRAYAGQREAAGQRGREDG